MADKSAEEIEAEKAAEAAKKALEDAKGKEVRLPDDHPLVKALAAQKEDLKVAREKAKRLDEIEEAAKSDLQKANDRAEAAEKALADRKARDDAEELRVQIAKEQKFEERKIPVSALRGTTKEELEAHAAELIALRPPLPTTPSADGQGQQGEQIGEGEMSAADIVAAATGK